MTKASELIGRLHAAANVNEMKAIVEKAGVPVSENALRHMLRARQTEEEIRKALRKPVKIGKPLTDRQLARAIPSDKKLSLWNIDDGDHRKVSGSEVRDVFKRWRDGEKLEGLDLSIFQNRSSAFQYRTNSYAEDRMYRRICGPIRIERGKRGAIVGFECGDNYHMSLKQGRALAMFAMNYWAGVSDERSVKVVDNHDLTRTAYVTDDHITIGCQEFDRDEVTMMAVEAGFWKEGT